MPDTGSPITGRADRVVAEHTRARIDDRTITPAWQGERLDLHDAVSVLLPELRGTPRAAA